MAEFFAVISPCRTPAMIGCSFVVDREYFGEIGLLDPGMEVYGGENIELGMRVSNNRDPVQCPCAEPGELVAQQSCCLSDGALCCSN